MTTSTEHVPYVVSFDSSAYRAACATCDWESEATAPSSTVAWALAHGHARAQALPVRVVTR